MDGPPPPDSDEEDGEAGGGAGGGAGGPEEDEDVKEQDLTHIIDGLKDAEATDEKDVPFGSMKVALMRHQKRALAWGLKREATFEHRGGILADDQGLGKTVSTLAIIVSAPPPVGI